MSWPEVTIGEIGEVFDGPHATPKPSDHGPVFLGIKNIRDDGQLDLSEVRHVSPEEFPRWTRRVKPQPFDVVFTYEATLHRYALIPEDFNGCLGRRTALVRVNRSRVDPRFLYYQFRSPQWWAKMEQNKLVGATVDRIPVGKFPGFTVRVPDLPLQRRIADVLSAYDDLIENNTRRMALLEESIHLLYREWFVYLRFPGHERVAVESGVPEGWRRETLGDLCEVNPESLSPRAAPATIEYVAIKDVSTGRIEGASLTPFADAPSRARRIVRHGDVIWSTVRPGNRAYAVIQHPSPSLVVSTGFAVLRPGELGTGFLYAATTQDSFVANMVAIAKGAAYPAVGAKDFVAARVLVPPRTLLRRYEEVAGDGLAAIHQFDEQNQRLREARDALLPRLMDGRITV